MSNTSMNTQTFVVVRSTLTSNGNQFCLARKLDAEGNPAATSVGFFLGVPAGKMYVAPVGQALIVTGTVAELRKAEKAEHVDHILFAGGVSLAYGEPVAVGTAQVVNAPADALASAGGADDDIE